jgi:hypothetical protein
MMHRLVDITGLCYAGMLERPKRLTGHPACSTTDCVVMTIDKGTYQVKHVFEGCTCPLVAVDRDQVAEVIRREEIPCVSFSSDFDGERKVRTPRCPFSYETLILALLDTCTRLERWIHCVLPCMGT